MITPNAERSLANKGIKSKGLIAAYFHGDFWNQKAAGLKSDIILVNATPTSRKAAVSFNMLGESCDFASKALTRVYEQDLHREIRQRLGLLAVKGSTERELFGVPPSFRIETSWSKKRRSELLDSFRRGERAPYANEWLRQANSAGWSLPEVEKLLETGRRRAFNASVNRRELRDSMKKLKSQDEQSRQGNTSSQRQQSQSKSSSQGHSH